MFYLWSLTYYPGVTVGGSEPSAQNKPTSTEGLEWSREQRTYVHYATVVLAIPRAYSDSMMPHERRILVGPTPVSLAGLKESTGEHVAATIE